MTDQKFKKAAVKGWQYAAEGKYDKALKSYAKADRIAERIQHLGPTMVNPELSLLRHKVGKPHGVVVCPATTEDSVVAIQGHTHVLESSEIGKDYKLAEINGARLEQNIRRYAMQASSYHMENLTTHLPHLLMLSTGRCGSISMLRLLEQTQYLPYHQCLFSAPPSMRFEMMCRHMEGYYNDSFLEDFWCQTRSAEWLGAMGLNRPAAFLAHFETIWAPTMATVHPRGKFLYLHRDPLRVFESFYSKGQWSESQLGPMHYRLLPFGYRRAPHDIPYQIAWYIKFTETFSRAFGRAFADRFIEISADKLFKQDEVEIKRLRDFLELDLPFHKVKEHFAHPHNEKVHKITMGLLGIDAGIKAFSRDYETL